MTPSTRKRVFQIGSFVLAGGLLWLAMRGVDFDLVLEDLREADYRWLVPIAVVTLLSHWLRAIRWRLFLEELPDDGQPVPTTAAFSALMIGYMTNYAAPRLGEIVRTANVATRFRRPFSGVLGTVAIERVLDMLVMLLAMATLPLVFRGRLGAVERLLVDPARAWLDGIPVLVLALVGLTVAVLGFLVYRRLVVATNGSGGSRLTGMIDSFRDGLSALFRSPHRLQIAGLTIGMWMCYALMAYLPFALLGFDTLYDIGLVDAWGFMLLGAIGVVIPSPGGVGSYHYITIQSLTLLSTMRADPAASYAIITHAGQLVLYVVVGFLAIVVQGTGVGALRSATVLEPSSD